MSSFNFFNDTEDLSKWIQSRESWENASTELTEVLTLAEGEKEAGAMMNDIREKCKNIYQNEDSQQDAQILMGVLAKAGIVNIKSNKTEDNLTRTAESRQRNNWERGMRNKFNRMVCGEVDPGTQWRKKRDEFYDFTHYTTDALRFDNDPEHIYSGEALWRMYIMDKFVREQQTSDGKWVGGYINDRFFVFPDAGTPANPDVPRDGGNQLALALGEKTRKPRPHQYSTERRLEEARGNKCKSFETAVASKFNNIVKIAGSMPNERHDNRVYNVFRDSIEMKEAGFEYGDMLEKISEHYDIDISDTAQIALIASKMKEKHDGVGYQMYKEAQFKKNVEVISPMEALLTSGQKVLLEPGTSLVQLMDLNGLKTYQIVDGPYAGKIFSSYDTEGTVEIDKSVPEDMQEAAAEVGLLD